MVRLVKKPKLGSGSAQAPQSPSAQPAYTGYKCPAAFRQVRFTKQFSLTPIRLYFIVFTRPQVRVQPELRKRIFYRLKKEGIEMPFPRKTV
jgi:small-conductance mechanosensitive channel